MLAWGAGWPVLEVEFWHAFEHVIEYLCEKDVLKINEKVLAWGAGWPVLEVEFWHIFEHVIEYLCERDVLKKCWHGGLADQF